MVSEEILREQLDRRDAVRNIESSLSKLASIHYELEDFESNSVQVLLLSLMSEGFPSFRPCFFKPYEGALVDPDHNSMATEFPQFDQHNGFTNGYSPLDATRVIWRYFTSYTSQIYLNNPESPTLGQYYQSPGIEGFPQLSEPHPDREWHATELAHVPGQHHFKCAMICDYIAGDQLTRGELLCICGIMKTLLGARCYIGHLVTPVMLLSWVGTQHCRILLAHYDGKKLIIRQSELFDFGKENVPALKLVTRWWLSSMVGDTKSP